MEVRVGVVAAAPDAVHSDEVTFPRGPVRWRHRGHLLCDGGDPLIAQVSVQEVFT